MTAPAVAAVYWLRTLAIGAALGLIYGFLRPLRPRLTALSDGIFVVALFAGWVYMAFGICGGESRLGCTMALFLGAWAWDATLGRFIQPVFFLFWKAIGGVFRVIFIPVQKFIQYLPKIYKFLLAILKKWVTIVWTSTKAGGADHGKSKPPRQAGAAQDQPCHKSRYFGRSRPVRGGVGRPIQLH